MHRNVHIIFTFHGQISSFINFHLILYKFCLWRFIYQTNSKFNIRLIHILRCQGFQAKEFIQNQPRVFMYPSSPLSFPSSDIDEWRGKCYERCEAKIKWKDNILLVTKLNMFLMFGTQWYTINDTHSEQ